MTSVSPGFVYTEFAEINDRSQDPSRDPRAEGPNCLAPEAIARAIAFAIDEPAEVDVNEIVVRPTAQG